MSSGSTPFSWILRAWRISILPSILKRRQLKYFRFAGIARERVISRSKGYWVICNTAKTSESSAVVWKLTSSEIRDVVRPFKPHDDKGPFSVQRIPSAGPVLVLGPLMHIHRSNRPFTFYRQFRNCQGLRGWTCGGKRRRESEGERGRGRGRERGIKMRGSCRTISIEQRVDRLSVQERRPSSESDNEAET